MSNKSDLLKALQPLVNDGTLTDGQRDAVIEHLATTTQPVASRTLKALLSEALVYLGGAIIFGSGALIIQQTWNDLGRWGRPSVLVGAAIVLWIAGILIQRRKSDDEGRRLTSTLLTAAAALVGFASAQLLRDLLIPVDPQGYQDWAKVPMWVDPAQVLISLGIVTLIASIAYWTSPSALALAVIGGSALGVSMSLAQLINIWLGPDTPRDQFFDAPYPWISAVLTGATSGYWLYLWKRDTFKEKIVAHVLGLVGVFIAINSAREYYAEDSVAIVLIIAGIVGLWLYVQTHQWPYLVFGLGSILVGGIQMLFKHVEGIGGALASMGLGAVLVAVGIWLVRERKDKAAH